MVFRRNRSNEKAIGGEPVEINRGRNYCQDRAVQSTGSTGKAGDRNINLEIMNKDENKKQLETQLINFKAELKGLPNKDSMKALREKLERRIAGTERRLGINPKAVKKEATEEKAKTTTTAKAKKITDS